MVAPFLWLLEKVIETVAPFLRSERIKVLATLCVKYQFDRQRVLPIKIEITNHKISLKCQAITNKSGVSNPCLIP